MDFLSPVLDLVGSQLIAEYARINRISSELKLWAEKLHGIQAVLDSAEEKQLYDDNRAISRWLADLRDVAYDMEDLLEHFSIEARQKPSKKRPFSLISSFFNLISRHHMANEIEDVDDRLGRVFSRIPALGLVQNLRRGSNNDYPRFVTSSVEEPKFVGRKKQKEELLSRLIGSEEIDSSIRPFTVVSIVGMGGLGKTTLAQELYNHKSLNFDVKAWACVSDVFDVAAITRSILDQVTPSSTGTEKDLNQLQNYLKDKISSKKFLIVLDDVWNDEYVEIESLLKPLYSGSKGSRILLTTRKVEVAIKVGDPDPKRLDYLSSEECLSLLAYHAIGEESFEGHPHLRDIAVQLAEKSKGLPLSIKVIGGVLRFEKDIEVWRGILGHSIWNLDGEIPSALKLSYIHLPIHLKRCFAACALFPKDYIFDQNELIRLWIIQGLLQKGTAKTYQEVGMKILHRLEAASFLQKVRDVKTCYSMHDLINELAKSVEAHSYFSSDEYKGGSSIHERSLDKVRHAAMITKKYEISKRFDVFREMKLRTFVPFQISSLGTNVHVSEDVIQDLIVDMKNVKMLSLRYFKIVQVPDQIGQLRLLRSIDFSYTDIQIVPESICDLVGLQFLLLRGCMQLNKLPRNIHKLVNLLHLDISGTNNLLEMPPHIGVLTNLEILSDFVVGKEVGQELKQLGPLGCLQRELNVHNLLDVSDIQDARIANLSKKETILELSLDWGLCSEISREYDHQFNLLHHLQPPKKIESLVVRRYSANRFPSWFNNQSCMENVKSLTLTGCRNVDSFPPFGQLPSLERLEMSGFEGITSIGPEFYGSIGPFFRSLSRLSFENMGAWEKWLSNGGDDSHQSFPCLRELNVRKCPNLREGCPLILPSLVEINIDGCDGGLLTCLESPSMNKMNISKIPKLVHFEGSLTTSWVALEEMRIAECPRLKCFMFRDGVNQIPPKLKILEMRDCRDLVKLPDDLCELTSLREMRVADCEKLCSFPSGGLPVSSRRLKLEGCPRLPQSQLIGIGLLDYLEELTLCKLEGLVSITELVGAGSPLSQSLRELQLWECRSLTTLTDSLQHLSALSKLTLSNCQALELEIFPSLPCNLSSFELQGCPNVNSLPHDMHHLTSLKSLSIYNCQSITSLSSRGGLPPNLDKLSIHGCRNLNQPIEEWGLRDLTALRELNITEEMKCTDEMECFPPPTVDGDWSRLLPSSLLELSIGRMKMLERVGGGLRHHLTSLQSLSIYVCRSLRCLPDDGLPDSLERLDIWGCSGLEGKCRKGIGEYWHSHLRLIPEVDIR